MSPIDKLKHVAIGLDSASLDIPTAARWIRQAIAELEGKQAPDPPKGRTVRVRIACAINPDGTWFATGGHELIDWLHLNQLVGKRSGRGYWITADLPIPEPVEVQGRVE